MDVTMSSFDITDAYITSAIFTVWVLPLLGIALDKTVSRSEKQWWLIAALLVSWVAWFVFAVVRSNRRVTEVGSTPRSDSGVFDLLIMIFRKLSLFAFRYKWLITLIFICGGSVFVAPIGWPLLKIIGASLFTIAALFLLILINRATIQPVIDTGSGRYVGILFTLLVGLLIFTAIHTVLSALAVVAYWVI
ncbi:hypothetical protein EDC38_2410 [Marinimicrobium koreense]|uniref:Uncharacterized protein n=1 Tax=Marinimicrobium koreense TaxID=306545 RepID=A0A3N1NSF6_9GAMM|nr:hypothetical protein [Marinimicrobium koreense]ROQ21782.1 hypothetical protein EDC38_2410 [Marinimicrobium koreense]